MANKGYSSFPAREDHGHDADVLVWLGADGQQGAAGPTGATGAAGGTDDTLLYMANEPAPAPRKLAFRTAFSTGADFSATTSWAVITSFSGHTIPADVGDLVELVFRYTIVSPSNSGVYIDFEVAGARFGDTNEGCWRTHATPNGGLHSGVVIQHRPIVSADLSGGQATFKPWVKVSSAMSLETTTPPMLFSVRNLGVSGV